MQKQVTKNKNQKVINWIRRKKKKKYVPKLINTSVKEVNLPRWDAGATSAA